MKSKTSKIILYVALGLMIALLLVRCNSSSNNLPKVDYENAGLTQLDGPKEGQEIAIIKTTLGEFRVALYREFAPDTVDFFVKNAKDGFYDGKYFYGIQNGNFFMFGTAKNDGHLINKDEIIAEDDTETEGKYDQKTYDIEHTQNENELSTDIWPLKGSLISLGPDYKGTGAFVVGIGNEGTSDDTFQKLLDSDNANTDLVNAFKDNGGCISFAQTYTVFAQVYEGMDVFDNILNTDVDSKTFLPKEELKVISVTIENYSK